MNTFLLVRMLKHVTTAWFVGASVGSLQLSDTEQRRRWAYFAAVPGFLALWWCGYVLLRMSGFSMRDPWILLGALGSLLTLWSVLWSAETADLETFQRRRYWALALAVVGLLIAYAAMVLKIAATSSVAAAGGGT